MGNNTDKNSSSMNDGLLAIIGFVSMAFLLFFVAFYMGKEMGKHDKTVFEEYMETLENDRDEMAGKLDSIESKIWNLEFKIGELEGKIDEMPKTATDGKSGADVDANESGADTGANESGATDG